MPFRRWLVRVAVNLGKNFRRDETRWTRSSQDLATLPAARPDASQRLEDEEASVRLRRAALRLPRRQREVLTLRIDADLPFAEIAAALDCTENAAKVSFHLAVKRLRRDLQREPRSGGRMTACRDVEPLLLDRAAGDLAADATARLEEHLAGCAACRAEAAALDRTLTLVRLPPPDAAERAAMTGLADSVRLAQQASAHRRAWPTPLRRRPGGGRGRRRLPGGPRLHAPGAGAHAGGAGHGAGRRGRHRPGQPLDGARPRRALGHGGRAPLRRGGLGVPERRRAGGLLRPGRGRRGRTPLGRDRAVAVAAADAWFDTDTTAR
ncbi:MAG: sigma-70 family RNA polymerase sigma factor [Candidatus Moduliflexus flocculans]|nr:sigma-70 family RNA polymerase sigma factor [Candidatus Moduliflexus flocculans]